MEVIVDIDSLVFNSNVTGIIFLEDSGVCFPDNEWNDFAVVVLTWWINSVKELEKKEGKELELRFMDGPYYANIKVGANDQASVRFIQKGKSQEVIYESTIDVWKFIKSLSRSANAVLRKCADIGYLTPDIKELRSAFDGLGKR